MDRRYVVVQCGLYEDEPIGYAQNRSRARPPGTRLNDQLNVIATALDRPKSWVIDQALRDFVAVPQWQLTAIDEGIVAADAGRVVAHDDVAAWVCSWGQPDERPMPECG